MEKGEKIVLGSGKLYAMLFNGSIPDLATIINDSNLLGLISGGASIEYKPKFYEVKDDLGLVQKNILTEEEATLKSGVLTWSGKTLKILSSTARVSEESGKRIVKIGGLNNQTGEKYLILFVHEDSIDGDVRILIVGNNQAGFTIKFAKDKETVVDAEFKAAPMDNEGTLIRYEEDILIGQLAVNSVAGSITGATKITVAPTLESGNKYMYKTASTVDIPHCGDVCNTTAGYTTWDGVADITATTGNELVIIEVDSQFKAVNAGKTIVTSK